MKPRTTWRALTAVSVLWPVLSACSQATFGGGVDRAGTSGDSSSAVSDPGSSDDPGLPPEIEKTTVEAPGSTSSQASSAPDPVELGLPCDAWDDRAAVVEAETGVKRAKIKGEICETNDTTVTVLLLVDTSTSMRDSDPVKQGTCGRLRAANALTEKLRAARGATIVVMTFADRAKSGTLDAVSLCAAQGQTNYASALDSAEDTLVAATGGRHGIYLISDGLPDVFGQRDPMGAGLEAADKLKDAVPGVKVNALYFGKAKDGQDPNVYLEKLVGASGEVRIVDEAGELAEAIIQVEAPAGLSLATFRLDVTWAGGPELTAKASSLEPVTDRPGYLTFVTEPIDLGARSGNETLKVKWRND